MLGKGFFCPNLLAAFTFATWPYFASKTTFLSLQKQKAFKFPTLRKFEATCYVMN